MTKSWSDQYRELMKRMEQKRRYRHWISFHWTAFEFTAGTKTVTRRLWPDSYAKRFKVGDTVGACDKALFRGGNPIGACKILSKELEALDRIVTDPEYGRREMVKEGFPGMAPAEFIRRFFGKARKHRPDGKVWRVEFEKTEP